MNIEQIKIPQDTQRYLHKENEFISKRLGKKITSNKLSNNDIEYLAAILNQLTIIDNVLIYDKHSKPTHPIRYEEIIKELIRTIN